MTNYERIQKNLEEVSNQAIAAGVNGKTIDRMLDVVTEESKNFKPLTFQTVDGNPGIRWDMEEGYLSVLFLPNDDWEWQADVWYDKPKDDNYHISLYYRGGPTYCIGKIDGKYYTSTTPRGGENEHLYYHLPEIAIGLISLEDTFDIEYAPMFGKHEYTVVWETNRYDGMLSGYVRYDNKLHYATCVDETMFERHRMFAVYELSLWERFNAWIDHSKWNIVVGNRLLWSVKMKLHQMRMRWNKHKTGEERYRQVEQTRDAFLSTHKIVGYFKG